MLTPLSAMVERTHKIVHTITTTNAAPNINFLFIIKYFLRKGNLNVVNEKKKTLKEQSYKYKTISLEIYSPVNQDFISTAFQMHFLLIL